MRSNCIAAIVLLGISTTCAENVAPAADSTGLTQEEIQQGFVSLFDGKTLKGWQGWLGGLDDYVGGLGEGELQPVLVPHRHNAVRLGLSGNNGRGLRGYPWFQ